MAGRDKLIKEDVPIYNPFKKNPKTDIERCLDPYHTHFLLPESYSISEEKYGVFRDQFEPGLAFNFHIPIIRIFIGINDEDIFLIQSAVAKDIPCLLVEVCFFCIFVYLLLKFFTISIHA